MNSWTNLPANFSCQTTIPNSSRSSANSVDQSQQLPNRYGVGDMECTPPDGSQRPTSTTLEILPLSDGMLTLPNKMDKMDFEESHISSADAPHGSVNSFRHRNGMETSSWWGGDHSQINNASNNNNTSTKSRKCFENGDHWNPMKTHTCLTVMEMCRKNEWMSKQSFANYDQSRASEVPFGTWYEGGDYEADILNAAAPMGSDSCGKLARGSFEAYDTSVATDRFVNTPGRDPNLTYSDLKVPAACRQTLPPISLLANKNDIADGSETAMPLFTASLSPSSSGYSPSHPFSAGDLSGSEYFMHDFAESPYQATAGDFNRPTCALTGNEGYMANLDLDVHHSAISHLGGEGVSVSEPIHRLKASRHKMTQRRLLHSLYQKKSPSNIPVESDKAEPRKCRPTGGRPSQSSAKSDTNDDPETEEQKTKKRLESNERERMRMHQLNDAFQGLRDICPHVKNGRKLSKIETLNLAQNYIFSLTEMIVNLEGNKVGKSSANVASLLPEALTKSDAHVHVNIKKENTPSTECEISDLSEVMRPNLRRSNSTPSTHTRENKEDECDEAQGQCGEILSTADTLQATTGHQMTAEFESLFGLSEDRQVFSGQ